MNENWGHSGTGSPLLQSSSVKDCPRTPHLHCQLLIPQGRLVGYCCIHDRGVTVVTIVISGVQGLGWVAFLLVAVLRIVCIVVVVIPAKLNMRIAAYSVSECGLEVNCLRIGITQKLSQVGIP